MITIAVVIEEVSPGTISIKQIGKGQASPLEFEVGTDLREAIRAHLDQVMVIEGNGKNVVRDGPGHGKPISEAEG